MKLDIQQGELKKGYFYTITNYKEEVIASGYYRLERHARYWGKLALSIYEREEENAGL